MDFYIVGHSWVAIAIETSYPDFAIPRDYCIRKKVFKFFLSVCIFPNNSIHITPMCGVADTHKTLN